MLGKTKAGLFRIVSVIITVVFALHLNLAATAQSDARAPDTRAAALDQLFAGLKVAQDKPTADRIAARIWQYWFAPDDPELAGRLNAILTSRAASSASFTMRMLDRLIDDYPDFAEGWNRRATLHYELGNYEESLADIAETLKREPRHFGALSGQALVYLALDDQEKARQAVEAAREIHPFIATSPPLSDLVEERLRI